MFDVGISRFIHFFALHVFNVAPDIRGIQNEYFFLFLHENILLVLNRSALLTLLLLNMTCPVLANSVDPDQLASEEAN